MNEITTTSKDYSLAELTEMSKVMVNGGLFGYTKPEQVMSLMLIAQAEGRHPAKVAQDYSIIQGKPALNAQAMLSRFQEAGGKIKWVKSTDNECELWLSHPLGGEMTVNWNIERAKTAGLAGKSTWKQYPAQMMRARAISEGIRAVFPACLNGMYTPEEVRDFDNDAPAENMGEKKAKSKPKKNDPVEASLDAVAAEIVNPEEPKEEKKAESKADKFRKSMWNLKHIEPQKFVDCLGVIGYEQVEDVPEEKFREVYLRMK